ncbi:MAG: YncE family protein, partial [Gemmatimonadales bacterium]
HAGTIAYISCMHSDEIVEIDVSTLSITRRIKLGKGHTMAGMDHGAGGTSAPGAAAAMPAMSGMSMNSGPDMTKECAATFVSVSADDSRLFVACNYGNELQVWDAKSRTLIKAVPTGAGAYNVEPSRDGRWIIVTNKKDQSISVIDAATLTERKRIPTTKKIVHGVAFSPDGRYAYISQESIGADPGAVDVLDLTTFTMVSSYPVAAQPTGITILRSQ